jgi:GlcNAc-P-P-Und epimerase
MKIIITGGSGFIGTNLVQSLALGGHEILNLDIAKPKVSALERSWINCDILRKSQLEEEFHRFRPEVVVHLAAETDTDPAKTLEDYRVNTEGTKNLLNAVLLTESVRKLIITSTQFVHQGMEGPQHDEDYAPHTIYGESKILSEQFTRNANLKCSWTIIRPTNIWGPWHLRYPYEFWKVLAEGKYIHPGKQRVVRSYGYVGNVVSQIGKILELPDEVINKKTYYVGDEPVDLYDWVNGFSLGQIGKNVRVVPRPLVYSLALIGDILKTMGIKFPITTSRYRSMTSNNPADMRKTFKELGPARYSLQEGIDETVKWLLMEHPDLVKIK